MQANMSRGKVEEGMSTRVVTVIADKVEIHINSSNKIHMLNRISRKQIPISSSLYNRSNHTNNNSIRSSSSHNNSLNSSIHSSMADNQANNSTINTN